MATNIPFNLLARVHLAQAFITTTFGYQIRDAALVYEALDTSGLRGRQANKRLALVGDNALAIAVVDAWYPTGDRTGRPYNPSWSAQQSSNISAGVCSVFLQKLSNANLANAAQAIGLGDHLILHPGHFGAVSVATLATSLEAVFGAIYRDCGGDNAIILTAMSLIGLDTPNDNN